MMRSNGWNRTGWRVLLLWIAVVLAVGCWLAPALSSDAGWGILAAEQTLEGYSSGIRQLVGASLADITRQTAAVVSWWAPSYQAVPYVFRAAGLSWGDAVTATGMLCFLLGIAGWTLCFRRLASPTLLPWLLLLVALSRYAHSSLYIYEGEALAFAPFPWALLCNLSALRRPSLVRATVAALATALLFVVKYSLLVQAAGCYLAWMLLTGMRRIPLLSFIAFAAVSLLVLILITVVGNIPGGPTPGSVRSGIHVERMLDSVAWLPLAITDLDSLISWAFDNPARDWLQPGMRTLLGLVLLLPFVKPLWRQSQQLQWRSLDNGCVLVLCIIAGATVVMALLLVAGGNVDDSARHMRSVALVALPWVLQTLVDACRQGNRLLWGALALVLCLLPAGYGAATLLDKSLLRFPQQQNLISPDGLRLDVLGPTANATEFHRAMQMLAADGMLLYYTSPDLALATSNSPLLIVHADFTSIAELGRTVYAGCPAGGVALVLPNAFTANGKADVIMRSFVDAVVWTKLPLSSAPDWTIWQADCSH